MKTQLKAKRELTANSTHVRHWAAGKVKTSAEIKIKLHLYYYQVMKILFCHIWNNCNYYKLYELSLFCFGLVFEKFICAYLFQVVTFPFHGQDSFSRLQGKEQDIFRPAHLLPL